MKKTAFLLLMLLFSAVIKAQESQTEYNFLRLPVSAHTAALGGDNITLIEDDPSLTFQNPALLASVSNKTVNFNCMTYMEGALNLSASYNQIVKEKASWAVMAQLMNYGTMKQMDENNVQTGEFSAKDIAIGGAFSYMLADKLVGGITAKIVASYIGDYSSMGVGIDLGLNYYDPDREWSVSVVAKNLGGQIKAYDEQYEKMPLDLQAGVSKRFDALPFRVSATLVDLNHWNYRFTNHLVLGADIILSDQIYVAAGYNFRRSKEMEMAGEEDTMTSHGAGLSFGGGIQLERFKLQVGYGKYHVSSHSLLVNVGYTL